MAAVAGGTNRPEDAARLYGAADAVAEGAKFPVSPLDLAEAGRHLDVARARLGAAAFDELAVAGRDMTMAQAVAYALEHQCDRRAAPGIE